MKYLNVNIEGDYAILTSTIKFKKDDITPEMIRQIPKDLTPDDIVWRMISHQEMKESNKFTRNIELQSDDFSEAYNAYIDAYESMPKSTLDNNGIITCYRISFVMRCYDENTEEYNPVVISSKATSINTFYGYSAPGNTIDEDKSNE